MSERKRYDNEFKIQVVKLGLEIGQIKAWNELNLAENTIYGRVNDPIVRMHQALKRRLPEGASIT